MRLRFQIPLLLLVSLLDLFSVRAAEWREVCRDDFDGKELDWRKWAAEENGHGGGNIELQYYLDLPQNLRVEDGHLILEARQEALNIAGVQKKFSSARIRTKRRASWLYGRIELRAKLPAGKGLWPAFWMLPVEEKYGPWAASGEIDIMEFKGQEPNQVHGTLHFGSAWPRNLSKGGMYRLPKGDFTDGFHLFALEWEPGAIRWFVDGVQYQELKEWTTPGAAFPAPFDQSFYLVLNLAVGGGFVGPVDEGTHFPAQFVVDYVRVLQR
jgi:beta-glucanase (GH16 family)